MKNKGLPFTAIASLLAALILLTASTYAWFTFRADATVYDLSGVISNGSGDLLIANRPDGSFNASCELLLNHSSPLLLPVTTGDLQRFFVVGEQDARGMAVRYLSADERAASHTVNGALYLKADGGDFSVYFWEPSLQFGSDPQLLSAMRLGLEIQNGSEKTVHIFRLSQQQSGVSSRLTVPQQGTVVSSIDAKGIPTYISDPAKGLSAFCAGGSEEQLVKGEQPLFVLAADSVATIRFWLYLEGCDSSCINEAQGKDLALQLGFAGVQDD